MAANRVIKAEKNHCAVRHRSFWLFSAFIAHIFTSIRNVRQTLPRPRQAHTFLPGFVFQRHRSKNFALNATSTSHINNRISLFLLFLSNTRSAPTRSPLAAEWKAKFALCEVSLSRCKTKKIEKRAYLVKMSHLKPTISNSMNFRRYFSCPAHAT